MFADFLILFLPFFFLLRLWITWKYCNTLVTQRNMQSNHRVRHELPSPHEKTLLERWLTLVDAVHILLQLSLKVTTDRDTAGTHRYPDEVGIAVNTIASTLTCELLYLCSSLLFPFQYSFHSALFLDFSSISSFTFLSSHSVSPTDQRVFT